MTDIQKIINKIIVSLGMKPLDELRIESDEFKFLKSFSGMGYGLWEGGELLVLQDLSG